jgi:hypothetical protein
MEASILSTYMISSRKIGTGSSISSAMVDLQLFGWLEMSSAIDTSL